eukprot:1183653-Prorocentrum_minimum.AAC.1
METLVVVLLFVFFPLVRAFETCLSSLSGVLRGPDRDAGGAARVGAGGVAHRGGGAAAAPGAGRAQAAAVGDCGESGCGRHRTRDRRGAEDVRRRRGRRQVPPIFLLRD